jgi:hypothetical protein
MSDRGAPRQGKSNVIHAAVVDALTQLGTPVELAEDEHDLYYGWMAGDYAELSMHMAGCRPRYELCTWQDRDWREFTSTLAPPEADYRKGIELTLTCACGLIRGRKWRYTGGHAELIRAITEG